MKRYILLMIIIYISAIIMSCGVRDSKQNINSTDEKNIFKYSELSPISSLSANSIIKYTNKYTSAPLYEWTSNAVLPIPCPGDIQEEVSYERMLTFSGVGIDEWENYVEKLKGMYECITVQENPENIDIELGYIHRSVKILDEKYNMYITIGWQDKISYYDENIELIELEDAIFVMCYMGNQENVDLTNKKQIKNTIINKLNIKSDDEFSLLDVSSRNNIENGYNVFSLIPSSNYYVNEQLIYMYLCITKGEEIMYLQTNEVSIGTNNNEIIFINEGEQDYMYILAHEIDKDTSMSIRGRQIIDKYILKNGVFVYENRYIIDELKSCKDKYVTLEAINNQVLLYELLFYENGKKAYYEVFSVGKEIQPLE